MASAFAITAAANTVRLDARRGAVTAFTVTNTGGQARVGRAELVAQDPASAAWFALDGEAQRPFGVNEAHQYSVAIAVPPAAPAGSYPFRLDMVGVENPDELYSQGPTVAVEVPAAAPAKRALPSWWWIAAVAAAVVLLIGGLAAFLLTRDGGDGDGQELAKTVTLSNTQPLDLDTGEVGSQLTDKDDIQYLASEDDRFIVPVNDARIVKAQATLPSQAECAAAQAEGTRLPFVRIAGPNAQSGLCVVTTDGRVSELEVKVINVPLPSLRPDGTAPVFDPRVAIGRRIDVDARLFLLGRASVSFTTRAKD